MKVMITGAAGQVGQALLRSAPAGVETIACARKDLDIGSAEAVEAAVRRFEPTVIINSAAYTAVDKAEAESEAARRINSEGPRNLARSAKAAGARLIHISTDFVFDGSSSTPYPPDAPTNPLSVYGLTKRDGEDAVLRELPERSVVVRTAWVYSAGGTNFVRTMLRLMKTHGTVRVIADQIGTPTAAVSLAEGLWKIVAQPTITGVHHWTDAGVASWYDFAVAIAEEGAQLQLVPTEVSVVPIATHQYPTPAVRPKYGVLDTSSLAALRTNPVHWRARLRGVLREMQDA
jgi:dTDP-4-dehydrorhamnose reductase